MLRLFRAIWLFRLFKLFKLGDLKVLANSITLTLKSLGNFLILLFIFAYIAAILGMQLFAGWLKFDDEGLFDPDGKSPDLHFDDIANSFLSVFCIMIGDNWNNIMYDT